MSSSASKIEIEIDHAVAEIAAVALADVEVADLVAGEPDGRGRVGLLDVHVERVEMQPDVIGAGGLDEIETLRGGVEQVRSRSG